MVLVVVVELEVLTDVVVEEVLGLVVGETVVVVVEEVLETVLVANVVDDVVGRVPPPASRIAAFNGSYQQLASLTLPLAFG